MILWLSFMIIIITTKISYSRCRSQVGKKAKRKRWETKSRSFEIFPCDRRLPKCYWSCELIALSDNIINVTSQNNISRHVYIHCCMCSLVFFLISHRLKVDLGYLLIVKMLELIILYLLSLFRCHILHSFGSHPIISRTKMLKCCHQPNQTI